jgi:DMSO/TMAO reductase YedYZ molybdopterin-dependent catalytic subunit
MDRPFSRRGMAGALAMGVAAALQLGLHAVGDEASPAPLVLAQAAIAFAPGIFATALIALLEAWAMRLAIGLAFAAFVVLGAVSALVGPRRERVLLAVPWLLAPVGLALPGANGDILASELAGVAAAAVAVVTAELLRANPPRRAPGRRRLLLAAGAGVVVLVAAGALRATAAGLARVGANLPLALGRPPTPAASPEPANDPAPLAGARLEPDVTANADFYVVDEAILDPSVDVRAWRLVVDGNIETPQRITFDELIDLPSVEQYHSLECIGNSVGGPLIGNALWVGVPVATLLLRARVRDGTRNVIFRSTDGYSSALPLDAATDQRTLVAFGMNGRTLPREHGFPARLLIPGRYGMKNVKWLERISALSGEYQGFWEQRGWSEEALVYTMSRIDVPGPHDVLQAGRTTTIGGIAYAGARGISKVEASTDGGRTWRTAQLGRRFSAIAWRRWAIEWTPETGFQRLVVRAYDDAGTRQTSNEQEPLPNGGTGLHTFQVEVRG